jgi:hypothetical protein
MVWGSMCYGSRSPLIFIQDSMITQRYIQEVLQPVTIPFAYGHEGTLFQQDNARPHVARISMQEAGVDVPPWSPRSADLSPIEYVWDMIRRKISNLARPPQTLAQLRYEVQVAWDSLPQEDIDYVRKHTWRGYSLINISIVLCDTILFQFSSFVYLVDNSTHILSTNQIYEIGQYGPITLVLKKLPRKFSLVKIAAGNFLTFSLFIDELYNNNLF